MREWDVTRKYVNENGIRRVEGSRSEDKVLVDDGQS